MSSSLSAEVDAFLDALGHGRRSEIDRLRGAILDATPGLTEHVKWNAPSYGAGGDDRITFRLQPGDRVELVLHRGAKRRTDPFEFTDASGLVKWATNDRGVVAFVDADDTERKLADVATLVTAWIGATLDR